VSRNPDLLESDERDPVARMQGRRVDYSVYRKHSYVSISLAERGALAWSGKTTEVVPDVLGGEIVYLD